MRSTTLQFTILSVLLMFLLLHPCWGEPSLLHLRPVDLDGHPGTIWKLAPGDLEYFQVEHGSTAEVGSQLMTDEFHAAALDFPGETRVALGPESLMEYLGQDGDEIQVRLRRGTLRFRCPEQRYIKIVSNDLSALASGAEAEVTVHDEGYVHIHCESGTVIVAVPGGELYRVREGQTLTYEPPSELPAQASSDQPHSSEPIPLQTDAPGSATMLDPGLWMLNSGRRAGRRHSRGMDVSEVQRLIRLIRTGRRN